MKAGERFGTTTVNKADAVEMQIVAGVLDALGILDKRRRDGARCAPRRAIASPRGE